MKKAAIFFSFLVVIYLAFSGPSAMPTEWLTLCNGEIKPNTEKRIVGYCAAKKCLTVYLAPWCPSCHRAHGMIISLVKELEKEGVVTTVVLGMDANEKLIPYAQSFPFPVLLDDGQAYFKKLGGGGVPFFAVSNGKGKIIARHSGAYDDVQPMRNKLKL